MGEYVIDKNSNSYSVQEEEDQHADDLQSGLVTRAGDVQLIIKDFYGLVAAATPKIIDICNNGDFYVGQDAAEAILNEMENGIHSDFYNVYSYLIKPEEQKKFLEKAMGLDDREKQKVIMLVQMMYATKELRQKIYHEMGCAVLKDDLVHASAIITLDFDLKDLYNDGLIRELIEVYKEFDEIMKIYTSPTIFKELGICDLNFSKKQAKETVLQAMAMDVANTSYLKKYISYNIRTTPYGANTTYICDRHTCAVYEISKNYDAIKSYADNLKKLKEEMMGKYALGKDPLLSYFDSYVKSLNAVQCIYDDAVSAIEAFRKKEHVAPYSIMHVYKDSAVDNAIREYSLGPSGSDWEDGTCFSTTIQKMTQVLRYTAETLSNKMPFEL